MKIQDRIKSLPDIEDAHWDSLNNSLVVYYSGSLDRVKILVCGAIADAEVREAIDTITFISSN